VDGGGTRIRGGTHDRHHNHSRLAPLALALLAVAQFVVGLAGLVIFATGLVWFSRMPADADFLADLLGPSLVVAVGLAATFVSVTVSAVDGIAESESGLASGLINTTHGRTFAQRLVEQVDQTGVRILEARVLEPASP
jgi:hypothetical protein